MNKMILYSTKFCPWCKCTGEFFSVYCVKHKANSVDYGKIALENALKIK